MHWKNIYEDFGDLPKSEQLHLFQAIKESLFPEPKEDIANMVREVRFSGGLACVHCGRQRGSGEEGHIPYSAR